MTLTPARFAVHCPYRGHLNSDYAEVSQLHRLPSTLS